jgi:hypothetical protein
MGVQLSREAAKPTWLELPRAGIKLLVRPCETAVVLAGQRFAELADDGSDGPITEAKRLAAFSEGLALAAIIDWEGVFEAPPVDAPEAPPIDAPRTKMNVDEGSVKALMAIPDVSAEFRRLYYTPSKVAEKNG